MRDPKFRISFLLISILVFVMACGLPEATSTEAVETEAPATDVATDAPTESAPPTEAAPEIQHTNIPVNLPEEQSGQAGDFDSAHILSDKTPIGGDRFTFGRFERPFNANSMDVYYPELDIINTEVFQDETWIFGRLWIKELGASSSTSKYAMELDVNLDGNADWLVIADKPSSTDWTVAGVRVFQDVNQDLGGEFPMLTDNVPPSADGFETLFFDQGMGENPDTAWVRISPNDPNIVEFALNQAAISTPAKYLISYWAARNIDPAIFDLNDVFTHEQAGAADSGLPTYYPIKAIAEIDNSCRMAVGFKVTGSEPGLCDVFIPQRLNDPSSGGGSSCNPTPRQILACSINPDPSYSCSFNTTSCSCECEYIGPK